MGRDLAPAANPGLWCTPAAAGPAKRYLGPGYLARAPVRRRQRAAQWSARICRTTLRPGIPVTPPPPWVAEPAWYRPRTGVRRSAYPAVGLA